MAKKNTIEVTGNLPKYNSDAEDHPFSVGKKYFFRTVTHYQVGECVAIRGAFVVLDRPSWVADTGEFDKFCSEGKVKDYENFTHPAFVNVNATADCGEWPFELPFDKANKTYKGADFTSDCAIHPFTTGKQYAIRTVTHYQIGRCLGVKGNFVILDKASWISDTGRWSNFCSTGAYTEAWKFSTPVLVNLNAISDATEYPFSLK